MKIFISRFINPLLLSLFVILIFAGCGKKNDSDASGSNYYVKFNVAGKSFEYKGSPYASFSQDNGLYIGGVGAFKDMGVGTKNVVSVSISSNSAIQTNTYSGLVNISSGGTTLAVIFAYIDENGKSFGNHYEDNADNKVTITSLSQNSVKGTFSGKIYEILNQAASPLSFSGEFYVKRMN